MPIPKLGYDDLIDEKIPDKMTYLAFRPDQIKSANGNNRQFDRTNLDIRFGQGLLSLRDPGPNPTLEQVQAVVDGFQKVAKSPLPITLVNSPADVNCLPVHIPIGAKPMGGVFAGRNYLFADTFTSSGEATVTVYHVLFHNGLQKVILG